MLFTKALVGETNLERVLVYVYRFTSEGLGQMKMYLLKVPRSGRTELKNRVPCFAQNTAIVSGWTVTLIEVLAPNRSTLWMSYNIHSCFSGTLKDGFALSKTCVGPKAHACGKRPKKPWQYRA